jgi:hypothetical protein
MLNNNFFSLLQTVFVCIDFLLLAFNHNLDMFYYMQQVCVFSILLRRKKYQKIAD